MSFPIEETMAAASIAGAGAGALANRSSDTTLRKIGEGVIGAAVGIFCGPQLADSVGAANEHARMAVGFAAGAAGAIGLTLFLDFAKSGNLRDWLIKMLTKTPAAAIVLGLVLSAGVGSAQDCPPPVPFEIPQPMPRVRLPPSPFDLDVHECIVAFLQRLLR